MVTRISPAPPARFSSGRVSVPFATAPAGKNQSMQIYEPQAVDLLMKLGLSVADSPAVEGGAKVVPVEGLQALSAAMSVIGGDAGFPTDVRLVVCGYPTVVTVTVPCVCGCFFCLQGEGLGLLLVRG